MKILVIQIARLGDILMTWPAMRALRRAHPQAEIHLLVRPRFEAATRGLECVDRVIAMPSLEILEPLAREITGKVKAPTIGIGASPACDGQVLVVDDVLGIFTDFKPRFVKHFANLAPVMSEAFATYAEEVKARSFPAPEHTFQLKKG